MRQSKNIVRPDFIQILMDSRKENVTEDTQKEEIDTGFATVQEVIDVGRPKRYITDDEILGQAAGFMFAGFDSVSGLMCFTSYELALHQDFQDILRAEIQSTLEECDGEITYNSLMSMKYMDMVICGELG